jgi:hypothetical protein
MSAGRKWARSLEFFTHPGMAACALSDGDCEFRPLETIFRRAPATTNARAGRCEHSFRMATSDTMSASFRPRIGRRGGQIKPVRVPTFRCTMIAKIEERIRRITGAGRTAAARRGRRPAAGGYGTEPTATSRRCIVKARIVPMVGRGIPAARLHLSYIERDDVECLRVGDRCRRAAGSSSAMEIESPRFKIDDYRGLDVKGKVVVVLFGYPKGLPGEEGAHLGSTTADVAERLGAIGLIRIFTLEPAKTFPWERVREFVGESDFDWVEPNGLAHQDAPGVRVWAARHAGRRGPFAGEADRMGGNPKGFAPKTRIRIQSEGKSRAPDESERRRGAARSPIPRLPASTSCFRYTWITPASRGQEGRQAPYGSHQPRRSRQRRRTRVRAPPPVPRIGRAVRSCSWLRPRRRKAWPARTISLAIPQCPSARSSAKSTSTCNCCSIRSRMSSRSAPTIRASGRWSPRRPSPCDFILRRTRCRRNLCSRDRTSSRAGGGRACPLFLATGYANGGEMGWQTFLAGAYHHPNDDLKQKIDWQAGARFAEVNYRMTRAMADGPEPRRNQGDFFGDEFAPNAPGAPAPGSLSTP